MEKLLILPILFLSFAQAEIVESNDKTAEVIKIPFVYPSSAREMGIEGTVTLLVNINKEGKVTNIRFIEKSGSNILDDAAKKDIERARFIPAIKNGKPVDSVVKLPIRYQLKAEPKNEN